MAHRLDSLQAQRFVAGASIGALAKKANVSDQNVRVLEAGGTVDPHVAQRIADALGVSLSTLGKKDV